MPTQSQPDLSLVNGNAAKSFEYRNNQPAPQTQSSAEKMTVNNELVQVHRAFEKLFAGPQAQNYRSVAHSILADHHPNHHIINIDPYTFDLVEFAAAGNATSEIEYQRGCFDVGREYEPAYGGRTYGNQPKIEEEVFWARSKYVWQGHEFLLYQVSFKIEYGRESFCQFLLTQRAQGEETIAKSPHIDALLLAVGQFSELPHKDIFVFEDNWTHRSKSMFQAIQDCSWDDVIVDPAMKKGILQDVVSFFEPATRELYMRYNLPYKRGIILHGSPGNGKTITIKALINHLQNLSEPIPTLYVKSMKDKCKGDQESLKELFKDARRRAPIFLILEDLDSLVQGEVRSHFLNEIDGLQSMDGILILGSTNHLSSIDSAISSRPSRFDRKYAFELPDLAGRERYAQHWRAKLADNADVDFPAEVCGLVAQLTDGFSFAYLKELFISALLVASRGSTEQYSTVSGVADEQGLAATDESADVSATANASRKEAASDAEHADLSDEKKKDLLNVPTISVPDTLQHNTFFATLQRQVKLLVKDMNDATIKDAKENEKKEEKNKEKKDKDEEHTCQNC